MFIFLLLAGAALCANKAILICCSWQYENYRHFSNTLTLQSVLEKNGYRKQDISVFMKEDILENKRNLYRNKLCVGDKFLQKGKDYTPIRRSTSYYEILNMVAGEDPIMIGTGEKTNLLIYITGHGGDGFIKYCNRSYIYKKDLTNALISLQKIRSLGKILFIADTCQADTLIDISALPGNISFLSTSLKGESSHSVNFNEQLNIFPIDMFVMSLQKLLYATPAAYEMSLKQIAVGPLSPDKIMSSITVHGPDVQLKEFFVQSHREESLYL